MSLPLLRRSSLGIAALAVVAASSAGLAQETRAFVAVGGQMSMAKPGSLPISDDAVRAIVAAHFQSSVPAGTNENALIIVVDANGAYVSGHASKGTVFTRTSVDGPVSDTSIAVRTPAIMVHRRVEGDPVANAVVVADRPVDGVMIRTADGTAAAGTASHGMFGMDIAPDQIGGMGLKHYAAGELGFDALMVTVVKLK